MNKAIATTIHGIVIPDVWDERGTVLSVAIFTYQEEKIRVIDDTRGKALKDHIRKRVSVDGVLSSQGEAPAIRIRHYRIDRSPPEPEK
jgi:hypothetical protein